MLSALTTHSLELNLALNTVLILVDAAIGYYLAPLLIRRGEHDDDISEGAVRGVRHLLTLVVAFYMFFTCLAYARQQQTYLAGLTGIVLLDIAVQLTVRGRCRSNSGQ